MTDIYTDARQRFCCSLSMRSSFPQIFEADFTSSLLMSRRFVQETALGQEGLRLLREVSRGWSKRLIICL